MKKIKFLAAVLLIITVGMTTMMSGCDDTSSDATSSPVSQSTGTNESNTTAATTSDTSTTGDTSNVSATPDSSEVTVTTEPATPTTPPADPTEKPDYSGGIQAEEAFQALLYDTTAGSQQPECGTGLSLCSQFYATVPFTSVGFRSPTWTSTSGYSLEYSLFAWDEDYDTTIEGEPLATLEAANWADGVLVPFTFEAPMPAGEYLLMARYFGGGMDNSGVWYMTSEFEGQRCYKNDTIWYDVSICMEISYTVKPNNICGPLSDSGLE